MGATSIVVTSRTTFRNTMSAMQYYETKTQSIDVKIVSDTEKPYNKGKLVATGGHGRVFVAHSWSEPDWVCAIKEIDISGNTKIFSRVVNEIAQLKKLNHHNVLHFEDAYYTLDDLGRPFQMSIVITPYIRWNLTTFLQRLESTEHGYTSWPWYFSERPQRGWNTLIQGLLHGLWYCHSQQPPIKHRDIKPENILITMDGENPRAVITDFGSSKEFIIGAATTHHYYTYTYEAPEQAKAPRDKVPATTLAMDVFQMGCCLTWIEGAMWDSENGVHKVDKAVNQASHQFAYNIDRVNKVLNEYCNKAHPTSDIDDWARIIVRKVIKSMVLQRPNARPTVMDVAKIVDQMIVKFDEAMYREQEAPRCGDDYYSKMDHDEIQQAQGNSDDYSGMDPDEAMYVEQEAPRFGSGYDSGMDHDEIQNIQGSSGDYPGIDTDEAMYVEQEARRRGSGYYSGMGHDEIQNVQGSSDNYSGIDTDEALVGMQVD